MPDALRQDPDRHCMHPPCANHDMFCAFLNKFDPASLIRLARQSLLSALGQCLAQTASAAAVMASFVTAAIRKPSMLIRSHTQNLTDESSFEKKKGSANVPQPPVDSNPVV